jgi:hypothetical protein
MYPVGDHACGFSVPGNAVGLADVHPARRVAVHQDLSFVGRLRG